MCERSSPLVLVTVGHLPSSAGFLLSHTVFSCIPRENLHQISQYVPANLSKWTYSIFKWIMCHVGSVLSNSLPFYWRPPITHCCLLISHLIACYPSCVIAFIPPLFLFHILLFKKNWGGFFLYLPYFRRKCFLCFSWSIPLPFYMQVLRRD